MNVVLITLVAGVTLGQANFADMESCLKAREAVLAQETGAFTTEKIEAYCVPSEKREPLKEIEGFLSSFIETIRKLEPDKFDEQQDKESGPD